MMFTENLSMGMLCPNLGRSLFVYEGGGENEEGKAFANRVFL
jgi:hypothetical protein